ncbi:hypothetical protein [Sphingomonas sp. HDW15A]|uniref:DUF418 domain-containing protein n=1 Tax=Sphingomonas sp. HDW15A TaxID=2714942 RepID=UPI001F1019AD|nr:hypothetical protein [Sphingomonas sp. HDW15A]
MVSSAGAPVDPQARSHFLDGLRGLALLGILIVNMAAFIGFGMNDEAGRAAAIASAFDDVAEVTMEWLFMGKFYSIFSLLFGIGFAIQLGRLEARGEGVGRYSRRLLVLFAIGLAHLLLLWIGDIVALYALMGMVLLLFRKASDRALLAWAVALWMLPVAWSIMIHLGGIDPSKPVYQAGMRALASVGIDPNSAPLPYYRDHNYLEQLAVHPPRCSFALATLSTRCASQRCWRCSLSACGSGVAPSTPIPPRIGRSCGGSRRSVLALAFRWPSPGPLSTWARRKLPRPSS